MSSIYKRLHDSRGINDGDLLLMCKNSVWTPLLNSYNSYLKRAEIIILINLNDMKTN